MIILDDISDTLWQIPIWQIPSSQNIQLTHTLLLLINFTYIAARYIKDEIVICKQNVFVGVILILLVCALKIFETGHLGTAALCALLYCASTGYRYKPLSTDGKAILITGRCFDTLMNTSYIGKCFTVYSKQPICICLC